MGEETTAARLPFMLHYIILVCHRGSQPQNPHLVGVDQEDPTRSSPGSTDPDKPEPLTEKQLKEVPVAVDVFGMETVSDNHSHAGCEGELGGEMRPDLLVVCGPQQRGDCVHELRDNMNKCNRNGFD